MNSELLSAAHKHNLAMAKADTLSHQLKDEAALGTRVSAAGYRWSAVGENVAYNGRRSEDSVLAVQKAIHNEKPPTTATARTSDQGGSACCFARPAGRTEAHDGCV